MFLRLLAMVDKSAAPVILLGISQSAGGIGTASGLGGEVNLKKKLKILLRENGPQTLSFCLCHIVSKSTFIS
jgi:hypothetical protein